MSIFKVWFSGHKTIDLRDQAWSVKLPNGEHITVGEVVLPGVKFIYNPGGNAPIGFMEVNDEYYVVDVDKEKRSITFFPRKA